MRLCSLAGCGKRYCARGYCGMHYKRWVKYGDPRADAPPLGVFPRPCKVCGVTKGQEGFELAVNGRAGRARRHVCRPCQSLVRQSKQYGVPVAEIERMLHEQSGRCRICSRGGTLCVDHDHGSGVVRGLLCGRCNVGLGSFGDDADVVQRAAAYLRSVRCLEGAS